MLVLAPRLEHHLDRTAAPCPHAATERNALVHERGHRHVPPFALTAEHVIVTHPRVGEEHLVELGFAGDLKERTHFHPVGMHVDHEIRHALVLGLVRVGTCRQQPVVRHMAERGPHLLTVDDPLVTVAHCPGRERRDIGARTGLAEHLAPDVLDGEDAPEVGVDHRFRAIGHQQWGSHADADRVEDDVVVDPLGTLKLLGHDRLHPRGQPKPTAPLGEVHPRETAIELCAAERHAVGGIDLDDEPLHAGAELILGDGSHDASLPRGTDARHHLARRTQHVSDRAITEVVP